MCSFTMATGHVCVISGSQIEGGECGPFDCSPGLLCDDGVCRRACWNGEDCISSRDCRYEVDGDSIMMCNITCDLVVPGGCPSGFKCDFYHSDPHDEYFSDCIRMTDPGHYGDVCEFYWYLDQGSRDCDAGYVCMYITDLEYGACIQLCPSEDAGTLSDYCNDGYPCCSSDTSLATADGRSYMACDPEAACSRP